jgi:hypothetical protein
MRGSRIATSARAIVPLVAAFLFGVAAALIVGRDLGAVGGGQYEAESYLAIVRSVTEDGQSLCASRKPTGDASCQRLLLVPGQPLPKMGASVYITKVFVPDGEGGNARYGYFIVPKLGGSAIRVSP